MELLKDTVFTDTACNLIIAGFLASWVICFIPFERTRHWRMLSKLNRLGSKPRK